MHRRAVGAGQQRHRLVPRGKHREDQFLGDQPPPRDRDRGEVEAPAGQGHLDGQADHVGEVPYIVVEHGAGALRREGEAGLPADIGAGERRPPGSSGLAAAVARWSCGDLLGAQGKFVVVVADLAGRGGQHGGVVAVQDLADPLGVRAEDGHELGGRHLPPLA